MYNLNLGENHALHMLAEYKSLLLTTTGAISSGFNSANKSGGRISSVNRLAAVGTMTLQKMLYFPPSIATVLANPTKPILAAE